MKPRLLVVDDDEDIRTQMKWALTEGYEVSTASNREEATAAFRDQPPQVVLLDLGLPPHPNESTEGLLALSEMLEQDRMTKVIIISGQTEKENALKAIGDGAYDFLGKPINTDELKIILGRAFHVARLEREYREMEQRLGSDSFEGMLGTSPGMQKVFSSIRKVATTDAPVLILGESGTGKEVAAQAIHNRSTRKDGPFVAINCSAIPESLLESELFGHEKGAFTGAHQQRKGRFEMASGGTLFLDEIGELPASIQVKLLRFLQEQIVERVGGRTQIQIDTRVIAATNADLKATMADGSFREDLYYRLAVVVIQIPPLVERGDDVELLARAFLKRFAADAGSDITGFNQQALTRLKSHDWPGNVRELENRVKRALIMAEGRQITQADLELGRATAHAGLTLKEAREEVERELVQSALRRNQGKISRAASSLGVSRPTFYELMDKLGITRD
jgi:two-component system NtrC family response regulator